MCCRALRSTQVRMGSSCDELVDKRHDAEQRQAATLRVRRGAPLQLGRPLASRGRWRPPPTSIPGAPIPGPWRLRQLASRLAVPGNPRLDPYPYSVSPVEAGPNVSAHSLDSFSTLPRSRRRTARASPRTRTSVPRWATRLGLVARLSRQCAGGEIDRERVRGDTRGWVSRAGAPR